MFFERRRWTAKVLREFGAVKGSPVWSVLAQLIRVTGQFDPRSMKPRHSVLISALSLRRRPEYARFVASKLSVGDEAAQRMLDALHDSTVTLCYRSGEHQVADDTLAYASATGQFRAPPVEALLHMRPRR